MFADKWRFNTCQDWEVLKDDFDSVNSDIIPDNTLQALVFHLFPLAYLEKGALWFVDVIDKPELAIEPKDDGQPITNSEDEKARKELERTAKRKIWCNDFRAPMQTPTASSLALLSSCPESSALLSCYSLMPIS